MSSNAAFIPKLFLGGALLGAIGCLARADYNLPLFLFAYIAWNYLRVSSSKIGADLLEAAVLRSGTICVLTFCRCHLVLLHKWGGLELRRIWPSCSLGERSAQNSLLDVSPELPAEGKIAAWILSRRHLTNLLDRVLSPFLPIRTFY